MSQTRSRERELFEQALEHATPEARDAFLRQACGPDDALLERVRSLLHAEAAADAGAFLAESPVHAHTERVGDRIGRYRLLEPIGEGGFGYVFRAEQIEPVRRDVALKILKPGMDSRRVIARFQAERQLLAWMDHPNIARVFDAGSTPAGRPYFVMEWVQGKPLTQYCNEARLSVRQRLELFIDVCDAVQHAHHKGVIHRDLKPSNILVTTPNPRPLPKVIDFGVAKAIRESPAHAPDLTRHHECLGTPAYMSPEQVDATLDVDTRSDVYALGVLLHELLCDTTPLQAGNAPASDWDAVRQHVLHLEPKPPALSFRSFPTPTRERVAQQRHTDPQTLTRQISGDLGWIVLRCLEKDRTRRYPSSAALAEDLRRHLANEPVSAAAPGMAYRMSKFYRRHRIAVGATLAIAIALLAATTVSGFLAWRAFVAEQTTQRVLVGERAQRARVEQLRRQSEQDAALARTEAATALAVTRFLNDDLLAAADPAREPERELTLRAVLDRASSRLSHTHSLTNEPAATAAIHETLGRAYQNLTLYPAAVPHFAKARDLLAQTRGADHEATLRATIELAFARHRSGDTNAGLPLAVETAATARSRFGPSHPLTLHCGARVASILYQLGRSAEAQQTAEDVYQAAQGQTEVEDADLLTVMYLVARRRGTPHGGIFEAGEQILHHAIQLMRERRGEDDLLTTRAKAYLAAYYYDHQQHVDRAESLFTEVHDRQRRVFGDDHESPLIALRNLGLLHSRAQRPATAQRMYLRVLAIRPDDPLATHWLSRLSSHPLPTLLPVPPEPIAWRVSLDEPPARWTAYAFNDASWSLTHTLPSTQAWCRTEFQLHERPREPIVLAASQATFLEAHLNGVPAQPPATPASQRRLIVPSTQALQALVPGRNVVAIHLHPDTPNSVPRISLHPFPSPEPRTPAADEAHRFD